MRIDGTRAHDCTTELALAYYAAFNRGDWAGTQALLADDVVVMASPDADRAAAEYVVHGEYLQADDGLPPAQGQRDMLPGGALFAIRDGVIARVTDDYNREDWLAQVR